MHKLLFFSVRCNVFSPNLRPNGAGRVILPIHLDFGDQMNTVEIESNFSIRNTIYFHSLTSEVSQHHTA